MEEMFENLKALQEVLSQRIELEAAMAEIPKSLGVQEEVLASLKKSFIETNNNHEKAKAVEAELRNSLAEAESKIEKAEKTVELISTQREYEAVDKEREDAQEKAKEFRAKLLKEERQVLDLDERLKQTGALIEQQEKDIDEQRKSVKEKTAEKKSELAALAKEEKKLTAGMDGEMLFKFERIIRNKMGRGIVAIKGGVCMGCHMILPAQFANTVRRGEEVVFCPYCSRILFYEESEQDEDDYFNDEDSGSLADLDEAEEEEYEDADEEKAGAEYEE